jgi:hypothetical protein
VRPRVWQPPVECSRLELAVMQRVKRARLFVWLREHRHELLDEAFQAELAGMYDPRPLGQPPVPPAQLALATILQAYTGASDDEVLEATVMDRRWQLVLDCMDHAQPPFSKGTLVGFRARLIAADLDRRLVERTVELYGQGPAGRRPGSSGRRWTPARCGARVGWRTRSTWWDTPCGWCWACLAAGRGGGWPPLRGLGCWPTRPTSGCWPAPASRRRWTWTGTIRLPASGPLGWCWPRSGRSSGSPLGCRVGTTRRWSRRWPRPGRSATRTSRSTPMGCRGSVRVWPVTGGSRSPTRRCVTAARRAASGSMATSGTCCATWTPSWFARLGSPGQPA